MSGGRGPFMTKGTPYTISWLVPRETYTCSAMYDFWEINYFSIWMVQGDDQFWGAIMNSYVSNIEYVATDSYTLA